MKIDYKITKKDKTMFEVLEAIRKIAGLKVLDVTDLYCSEDDANKLRALLVKQAKKEMPYASEKQIELTVGMEWLNLGPNTSMADDIWPGKWYIWSK